jgi:hypothetical protein
MEDIVTNNITQNALPPKPAGKVYTDRHLYLASFLGGPLAIGYLFSKNYKVFNDDKKAMYTWVVTIIFSVLLLVLIFSLPEERGSADRFIPIIYTAIAVFIFKVLQGKDVDNHINNGGEKQSWGRVVAVSLIGMIILISVIFGYIFLTDSGVKTKTYGTTKNEILYDDSISDTEIDELAFALQQTLFFNDEYQQFVYITKHYETIEISIALIENGSDNPEAISYFTTLRDELQLQYTSNPIIINLCAENDYSVVKRKITATKTTT